jgi:transcriptional regulator with XRE-family HTH domain
VDLYLSRRMRNERSLQRFGEKLRTLRVRHDMTLKEIANKLGLTAHGYISELEAGKKMPTAELVLNVARLFDVTTDELLKDELELTIN